MDASLTFVGTATTILRLGPFTVLTDPNFLHRGQRVHLGYGLTSRRRTDPAVEPEDLPPLDAVLLSHLHGDHFDRVARERLDRSVPVVTTEHAARRLGRWGFSPVGLPTWEAWTTASTDGRDALRVTAVPARHGPAVLHRALPPVMGSVLDLVRDGHRVLRVYVTGDTVPFDDLATVPGRLPGIDVMVAHLGGTSIGGVVVTMDDRMGADLVETIAPGTTVPVHYDDYPVFRSPLTHFLDEMRRRGLRDGVQVVPRGQTRPLPARVSRPERVTGDAAG